MTYRFKGKKVKVSYF